jgi:hypothetical protein
MNKKMLAIDLILIVGSLLIIGSLFSFSTSVFLSPGDEFVNSEDVLFDFERPEVIWLDDNIDFESPKIIFVEDGEIIRLEKGTHYFKFSGELFNEIREITVLSDISLKLRFSSDGERVEVVNAEENRLRVNVFDADDELQESFALKVENE